MNDAFVQRLSTVMVVVCLLVLTGTAALVVSPSLRRWVGVGPDVQPPPYAVGDQVDIEAGTYRAAPLTLVLFARSNCAACRRSEAFHKEAVASVRAQGIPAVLMTPLEDIETERTYAGGLGIGAADVHTIRAGSIKLRSVPALMVVDSSGLIHHVWYGVPDAATQPTILATVAALTNARVP